MSDELKLCEWPNCDCPKIVHDGPPIICWRSVNKPEPNVEVLPDGSCRPSPVIAPAGEDDWETLYRTTSSATFLAIVRKRIAEAKGPVLVGEDAGFGTLRDWQDRAYAAESTLADAVKAFRQIEMETGAIFSPSAANKAIEAAHNRASAAIAAIRGE